MDGQMGEGWGTMLKSMGEAKVKLHIPAHLVETLKNFENP